MSLLKDRDRKKKDKPYIDSQILLNSVLTKFGESHNFHRQFRERHANSDSGQVLGMQLYHLMIKDSDVWVYCETKTTWTFISTCNLF